jgi:hypothetical protein
VAIDVSLATPPRIQTLQRTLCLKAKREPTFRFYSLYDKVCRADILAHAYTLSKANGGVPGVDGMRFADIEAYAGDPHVRFDEREVETGQGVAREAPATERAGQRIGHA